MSILPLITRLKNLDIHIELVGDQLKVNAPEGALNPGLLSELKERKAEIIAFLQKSLQVQWEYQAILPSEKREFYVLSPAQKRLFILQQMEPGSLSYNQPRIMCLEGDINLEKLQKTFNGLVSRHESLRTSFALLDGEPVQRVYDTVEVEIEYVEAPGTERTGPQAPGTKEELIIDAVIKTFIRPFDLSRAPLFRVGVIKKPDQTCMLMMDMHHIISDGTSVTLFMKDFTALLAGTPLPPVKLQYRDCAQWQSREPEKQAILKQEKYWLNRLAGEIPVLDLPIDFSRPAIQGFEGNTLHFQVDTKETQVLKEIASAGGATLFMVLLAVSNILLSRLSGQEDFLVGTPTAGRKHDDMQTIIGMFVNTLVLRCPPQREKSFNEFLREVKENTLQAFENQDYPFEDLVETLAVDRDMSRNPLFDVMFILQNIFDPSAGSGEIEVEGLKITPYTYKNLTAKFDLVIGVLEQEGNLCISFEYYTRIFKEETIARYAGYFQKIISTVVGNPRIRLAGIDIITEQEKRRLLIDFNRTNACIPADKQVHQLFAGQVEKTPDHIAVLDTVPEEEESTASRIGRHVVTYRVLAEQSTRMACFLNQAGVQPDTIIAVMMVRSLEMITVIMGILKAGGAYLPIDPEYPLDRVNYILADSGAKLLVTTGNLVKEVKTFGSLDVKKNVEINFTDSIDMEFTVFSSSHLLNFSTPHSFHSFHPSYSSNLAYVIYTSGSTGKPKGVLVQHDSVVNVLTALFRDYPLLEDDTYLLKTTYTFDVSVSELFGWFLGGGRLAVLPPGHEKEPQKILDCIEEFDITHINFVPSMFAVFLEIVDRERQTVYKLSGLKYIFLAGEALLPQMVLKFKQLNTAVVLENIYGPTESTIYASQYSLSQWNEHIAPNIPIGKPLQNIKLYIMNRYNHVQPVGIPGELYISGKGLARGYLNRPGLTREKFIPQPLMEKAGQGFYERFYRSGDLVRWLADGNIEFLGRIDTQVKIRGFRIEPGEIESLLLIHHAVKEALVLTREDHRQDNYLCAYIVADTGITVEELEDFLADHLPGYMIPAYFILLEQMPLNPSGKIDRKALPLPLSGVSEVSAVFAAPGDQLQEKLVKIWSDLLAIPEEKISINANFFKMGGQSLKAVLLTTRIHKELNVRVPLSRIFKFPRIRDLSEYIKKLTRQRFGSIPAAEQKEYYGLSSAQKRVYILQQLNEQGIEYNIPSIYILTGDVHKEKLTDTFRQLIQRHESLRTSFELRDDEPVQRIHRQVDFEIESYDYEHVLKDVSESEEDVAHASNLMSRSLIEDFIRSFDLSRAPLLRVALIKVENQNYLLILDIHHIVTDGTSMDLMVTEFFELYTGNELPLLRVQYKDFVHWQTGSQQEKILLQQEKFWLNEFEGELPVLNLPVDYPRPLVQSFAGCTIHFELSEADDMAVKRLAQKEGTTLFMILLSFYSILLSKLCNQEYLIIGTPIASRNHIELENMIGMFVNFLALRTFPRAEKTFIQVLREVKESTARAFENQDYPFEELVKRVKGDKDTSRNPIFDVMLTMQNPIGPGKEIPGLKLTPYRYENLISKLDLSLQFTETASKVFYRFEYSTKLFKAETIEAMVRYFKTMVSSVLKQPGLRSAGIEILPALEKKHLLIDLNDTGEEYPQGNIISGLFEEQVQRTPEKTAVRSTIELQNIYDQLKADDIEVEISYEELNERANQLAHLLREMGVGPDNIVGLLVQHPVEKVIGIWGILKAGGAYLPIDPLYPQTVINDILADSRVQWLISESELADCLADINQTGHIHVRFIDEIESGYSFSNPVPISAPAHLAYIIYTSGTTGKPKGTAIRHNGIINYACWRLKYFRFTESDVTLQPLTYSFDSFCANFYPTFLSGGELVMVPDNRRLDFSYITGLVNEYRVTNVCFAPGLYDALLEAAQGEDLQSLRLVVLAGEASSQALLKKSRTKVPHVWLANEYGPTEGTVAATCHPEIQDTTSGIIGNPIANANIYILNDSLQPVLPGAVGEICIGGTGVARGYINNPVLTSQKFVNKHLARILGATGSKRQKNSPRNSLIFYKTGDLGRWQVNEGNWTLEFLGRKDHQVKIRGHRIELEQVEAVLSKHDKIKEVLVDIKGTEDSKYICAYIVPMETVEFYTAEIKRYLQERLPYYMVPSRILRVEKFPLTPNGKIDRKALPDPGFRAGEEYTAPRNSVERSLARIWAEVLNINIASIGIDSNFFDLGGHSLRATIVISRIHKALHIRVPLEELFRSPTIRGVCKYIRGMREERYTAIEPVEKREYYALSSAQKRLYILQQMEADHIGYNIPQIIPLSSLVQDLDKQKLETTFKMVIARHESLRTSFALAGEEPVQIIHEAVPFAIDYFETQERNADHLIGNFTRPFDLSRAPLLRVGLTEIASSHFMLLLDMHHIITDGSSQALLIDEFKWLYGGEGEELPLLRLQYKDYSQWENSEYRQDLLKEQEAYWLTEFLDELPVLHLPADFPRPLTQSFEGSVVEFILTGQEAKGLTDLAKETGTTHYMCILAIYTILLAKLSNQEDIIVGTPIAARRHTDLEHIIGMFVNTLAMRNYSSGEKNFNEFLLEVKHRTLKAFENQEYPFEELVEKVKVTRDASRNPIFDVMFSLQNLEEGNAAGEDHINVAANSSGSADQETLQHLHRLRAVKFDLTLTAVNMTETLLFALQYSRKLFLEETVKKFADYFKTIASIVVENPGINIFNIEILSSQEKKQLLEELNDTGADYPATATIHQWFRAQVEKWPEHIAARGPLSGNRDIAPQESCSVTYSDLDTWSDGLAALLKRKGIGPGKIVALMNEPCIEMLVGILGVLKAGSCYLPLDPHIPAQRLHYILKDSESRLLLTQTPPEIPVELEVETLKVQVGGDEVYPDETGCAEDPVYMIYTSGTSGKPKGVVVNHSNLVNYVNWFGREIQLSGEDKSVLTSSVAFDLGYTAVYPSLLWGGQLHLLPRETYMSPESLLEYIHAQKISYVKMTPSLFSPLVNSHLFTLETCRSLRWVILGGEPINVAEVEKAYSLCSHLNIMNHYGPTEVTIGCIARVIDVNQLDTYKTRPTIGKPIFNTRVYIVDKYMNLLPMGVAGELVVSGAGVARGYFKQEDLTGERFIPNPFMADKQESRIYDRIYRTGDLARWWKDGNIEFLGRIDQQIKIRGFRVELGEIENQLAVHEEIKDAAVIMYADKREDQYLCAYIVAHKDKELTGPQLQEFLAAALPDYMVPSVFVFLEALPLTPNGKLDRKALPEPELQLEAGSLLLPGNDTERKLLQLWSDILSLEKEKISIDNNFFKLGGNSLKATVMISKVHKEFNVKIPLAEVFKTPTIMGLSPFIQSQARSVFVFIDPVEKKEYYPLSSAQKRLYFLQQMDEHYKGYNMPMIERLEGDVEKDRIEATFKRLILRHESLRTSFQMAEEEPVQKIREDAAFAIEYCKGEGDIDTIIRNFVRAFDLSKAPLLRVGLIKNEEKKYILMVDMHHIISDGISMDIFINEFITLYEGEILPPLRLHYKDYSEWQGRLMNTRNARTQEEYWINRFKGEITDLLLPTDHPRSLETILAGDRFEFTSGKELNSEINRFILENEITLFMLLQAAFIILQSKYTGQEDIIMGCTITGRRHVDLHHIIGMFVNMLPMRNFPKNNKKVKEFLAEVKENSLNAYENQDYQFDELVSRLNLKRELGRNPLFNVVFALQNFEMPVADVSQLEIPGLKLSIYKNEYHNIPKFDLFLGCVETGDEISFEFHYRSKWFEKTTIQRMGRHYLNILEEIIKNPGLKISQLQMLSQEEKQQLIKKMRSGNDALVDEKNPVTQTGPGNLEASFDF